MEMRQFDRTKSGLYQFSNVLKGAKTGDLPVEQPPKFELAIKLKTAKALVLKVPTSPRATADEVIK